jgi:hypothetical protein
MNVNGSRIRTACLEFLIIPEKRQEFFSGDSGWVVLVEAIEDFPFGLRERDGATVTNQGSVFSITCDDRSIGACNWN